MCSPYEIIFFANERSYDGTKETSIEKNNPHSYGGGQLLTTSLFFFLIPLQLREEVSRSSSKGNVGWSGLVSEDLVEGTCLFITQ